MLAIKQENSSLVDFDYICHIALLNTKFSLYSHLCSYRAGTREVHNKLEKNRWVQPVYHRASLKRARSFWGYLYCYIWIICTSYIVCFLWNWLVPLFICSGLILMLSLMFFLVKNTNWKCCVSSVTKIKPSVAQPIPALSNPLSVFCVCQTGTLEGVLWDTEKEHP